MTQPIWQAEREKNSAFWLTALLWGVRIAGRGVMRWLVLPMVVLFFLIFAGGARRASRAYLSRVLNQPVGIWQIGRHFYSFASVSTDRILLMEAGANDLDVELVNEACFDGITEGAVLMTSHFGSFDIMRVLADQLQPLPVHILLDITHNARALALLSRLNPEMAERIVDAGMAGPALVLKLKSLLASNALVGIMADRVAQGQRQQQQSFLGDPAAFPMGPWLLAAMLKRPVILCFGAFVGGNRYRVEFQRLDLPTRGRTQERAATGLAQYVACLEQQVRRAPLNWFNFYDFWMPEPPESQRGKR